MPIVSGDIHYRLSGGAANSTPSASLGGAKSSTQVTNGTLFDDVSGAESAAGHTDYRCVYVHNNHGTLTLQNAKVWIQTNTPSSQTTIALALAGEGLNGTAETIANENTAPAGESFSSTPVDYSTGLSLTNIPAGQHYAVWIRRVVDAGAAAAADSFTIRVEGDTAA
jgi:hypothetical protein